MNRWNIPEWLEAEVRRRDKNCIYCGIEMELHVPQGKPRGTAATWEHIVNDASLISRENIALCCSACNSSKGQKRLADWLRTKYCTDRGITEQTVAAVAKAALAVG
jgi:5-methylcytosine-specific restriction endonuclease McrA